MAARKLDAMLIGQPDNRRYLSGYSASDHGIGESAGALLIRRRGPDYLLTDFRFSEQAAKETEGFEILLCPGGLFAMLEKLLPDLAVKRLGFESDYTLHSTAVKIFKLGRQIDIEINPLTDVVERMRRIKTEDEIARIRKSVRLNEQVFGQVFSRLGDLQTEIEMALALSSQMRLQGAEKESFETIVAAGPASSLPHAVPTTARFKKNGPVVVDMGLILDGYCSDMTRSFCYGTADDTYKKIHRTVRLAQRKGIEAVRAGVTAQEVDRAARSVIAEAGYGEYFGHALGHGVGLAVHEEPRVSSRSRKKLQAGMVITIEPGIYIPGWGGIRLEDMVVVREDGCENLNCDTTWLDL